MNIPIETNLEFDSDLICLCTHFYYAGLNKFNYYDQITFDSVEVHNDFDMEISSNNLRMQK